jgi:hypothetical protein
MRRRRVLALSGIALASLAGCSTDDDGDGPADGDGGDGTPSTGSDGGDGSAGTTTDGPTPAKTAEVEVGTAVDSVAVDDASVRQSVRYLTYPDAMDVLGPDDRQFAFVRVDATAGEAPPSRGEFALRIDDETYEPRTRDDDPDLYGYAVDVEGTPYVPDRGDDPPEGWIVFAVPTDVDAERARVELAGGDRGEGDTVAWTLPDATRAELRPPHPSFTVESADATTETPGGEPAMVCLTVTNEGGTDGVFRAAINHEGPLYAARAFEVTVPSGETEVVEAPLEYYDPEDVEGEIHFAVVWADGSESWTVALG